MIANVMVLEDRLAKTFLEKLRIDVRDPEEDLIEAGLLDSLMFVDLLLHLERDFQLTVTFETLELDHFRSIRRIAEFIAASSGVRDGASSVTGPHLTASDGRVRAQTLTPERL